MKFLEVWIVDNWGTAMKMMVASLQGIREGSETALSLHRAQVNL